MRFEKQADPMEFLTCSPGNASRLKGAMTLIGSSMNLANEHRASPRFTPYLELPAHL